jgi:hypothetical protein
MPKLRRNKLQVQNPLCDASVALGVQVVRQVVNQIHVVGAGSGDQSAPMGRGTGRRSILVPQYLFVENCDKDGNFHTP